MRLIQCAYRECWYMRGGEHKHCGGGTGTIPNSHYRGTAYRCGSSQPPRSLHCRRCDYCHASYRTICMFLATLPPAVAILTRYEPQRTLLPRSSVPSQMVTLAGVKALIRFPASE